MKELFKSWHACDKCGLKLYPNTDLKKLYFGNTVMYGTCPECGKKNKTLCPERDFQVASGERNWLL